MTPQKIRLGNCAELSAISTDKFKTASVSLSLALPADRVSIACNALLPGVLRRGSEKYPSAASLNLALDELYATTIDIKSSVCGKNIVLSVVAELLDRTFVPSGEDLLSEVLDVMHQLIFRPLLRDGIFYEELVEKEKTVAKDALRAALASPRAYAEDICAEILNSPDGAVPTLSELITLIDSLDAKKLYDFYLDLINNTTLRIFYVGSEEIHTLSDLLKNKFSEFCGKQTPLSPALRSASGGLVERSEQLPVNQGKLVLGFCGGACLGEQDYFATLLLNNVFGALPSSKLFMNVREALGLCYYCSSHYNVYTGDLRVSAGIDNSNKQIAIDEILRQLEQIKAGNISDGELSSAKAAMLHGYRQIYDYPLDLMNFYSSKALFGICHTPEEASERIMQITKEDISRSAHALTLKALVFVEGVRDDGEEEDYE